MATKEEVLIQNAQELIDSKNYDDNKLLEDYKVLLKSYKKIFKQYNKIVKIGDNYSSKVMTQNDKFKTFTKKTILNSVSSKRKLETQFSAELLNSKKQIKILKYNLEEMTAKYQSLLKKNAKLTKVRYIKKPNDGCVQ